MDTNIVPHSLLATDQTDNGSTNKKKNNVRHNLSVFVIVSAVFLYSRVTLVVSWVDLTGDQNHPRRGQILGCHVTYCLNSSGMRWENTQVAIMFIGQTVRRMVVCSTKDHRVYDTVGRESNDNRSG